FSPQYSTTILFVRVLSIGRRSSSSSFFFSITRPPPSSTLFPYTTLFRSPVHLVLREIAPHDLAILAHAGEFRRDGVRPQRESLEDRKSTRLNSSHVSISYAVFCLKKKNTSPSIMSIVDVEDSFPSTTTDA